MDWDEQQETSGPRPCERCGAGAGPVDSLQAAQYAMCREMMMGANRPGWLCYDCRKSWLALVGNHESIEQLIMAELEYDVWRSRAMHPVTTTVEFSIGRVLVSHLRKAKQKLDNMASAFCDGRL